MSLALSILYRGDLSSCNYACDYCPFAKRRESKAEVARDRAQLERFVGWVRERPPGDRIGVLFTPWGEGLVRPYYQQALVTLSNLPQVERVAIQTNLSCDLAWVEAADQDALALWATYHPTQVTRERFLAQCHELDRRGVRYSAGVVALREHFPEIEPLRAGLDPATYLWLNAYKRDPEYYSADEVAWLTSLDPHFPLNNQYHPTRGLPCRAGQSVISVDGEGTVRRCHFIEEPLGNLYEPDFERCLRPRPCSNERCGCFIGYVHFEPLKLDAVFGPGALERIPLDGVGARIS